MKLLAHISKSFDSQIVTVYEVFALRLENPEVWEGKEFYDIIKLRPMTPVNRGKKSSSFAFLGGGGNGHGLGSKGIAHELVQEYICKLQAWTVKIYGKEFSLQIESSEDEWHVKDSLYGKNYFVDCVLYLSPESDLFEVSGGKIGIEVTDSHKTGFAKRKALARAGHVVLELNLIQDWHITNEMKVSSDDLKVLRSRINGFLRKGSHLTCLTKPDDVRI